MGAFNNHVDIILLFFDHPPTSVDIFYVPNMDKNSNFWTTYPPPLVHVVNEWPLLEKNKTFKKSRNKILNYGKKCCVYCASFFYIKEEESPLCKSIMRAGGWDHFSSLVYDPFSLY